MTKINVLKFIPDTVVDGPHLRSSLYVSGCFHRCPQCHNQSSWPKNCGEDIEISEIIEKIKSAGHKYLTISGGDPFCYQDNECAELCKILKQEIPGINIWAYTGFLFEEIQGKSKLLDEIDGLVDGKFDPNLKSDKCLYRGSENQRIWIRDSETLEFKITF